MTTFRSGIKNRPAVLLTGFGPFPGVPTNETARLVPALAVAARGTLNDYTIHHEILPAEWNAAPERLSELLNAHKPVLALHFGVARDATGFRIECEGHNSCHIAADARGDTPPFLNLIANGALSQSVTVPVARIVQRLRSLGLPAYASNDAGRYICNAVLYHSLSASKGSQNSFRAGFIHIPTDLSVPPLTFEAALLGSIEILKTCVEQSGS